MSSTFKKAIYALGVTDESLAERIELDWLTLDMTKKGHNLSSFESLFLSAPGDLHAVCTAVSSRYGMKGRSAETLARYFSVKGKQQLRLVRNKELGVRYGLWIYCHLGKQDQCAHKTLHNKPFLPAKGLKQDGRFIHPGLLHEGCHCDYRAVVPGFDDDRNFVERLILKARLLLLG